MRSRARSLPWSRWRLTASGPPPSRAVFRRCPRSSSSDRMCSRFWRNSSDETSTLLSMTDMWPSMPRRYRARPDAKRPVGWRSVARAFERGDTRFEGGQVIDLGVDSAQVGLDLGDVQLDDFDVGFH